MRKNTWYAVYHQRELEYLARSYQPGYFFMFMGRAPMTEYLPIDGSKPFRGDLLPDITTTHSLGSVSKYWKSVYCQNNFPVRTYAGEGAGQGFRGLMPIANNTYDIGNASYKWKDIFFSGTMSAGDITGLAGKALTFPVIRGTGNVWADTKIYLAPLGAAPVAPASCLACANPPAGWDPLGRGAAAPPYLVYHDGVAWKAVSAP